MSFAPEYMKIREYLIGKINSASTEQPTRIEPERTLCRMFDVSRKTVRNATRQLVDDGFLVVRRGMGTYINPDRIYEKSRPSVIGVLFGDGMAVHHGHLPELAAMVKAIGASAMMFRFMYSPENLNSPTKHLKTFASQLSAVIWFRPGRNQIEFIRKILGLGVPVLRVAPSYKLFDGPIDSLVTDNYGLGRLLYRYLADAGHTRVLHVASGIFPDRIVPLSTLAGYRDAMAEAGLTLDPALVPDADRLKRFSALIEDCAFSAVYSSVGYVSAITNALRAAGRSIPEDISYVVFSECAPRFFDGHVPTTIGFPDARLRTAFTEWLDIRLPRGEKNDVFHRTIKAEIVEGETVRDIRGEEKIATNRR